jgi:hypothetical protein
MTALRKKKEDGMAVTRFDEFLSRIVKIGTFVVLILAIIWFFGGFNKTKKPVAEVLPQSKQQCMEHTMCDGHEQVLDIKRTTVVLKEILPPPPCGVQEIYINHLTVQTQIINNDINEVRRSKPVLKEVTEEQGQQGALIEHIDLSGGCSEVHSSGGTFFNSGWGYHMNTGNGGTAAGWGRMRGPNPPGCGLNTQGCLW